MPSLADFAHFGELITGLSSTLLLATVFVAWLQFRNDSLFYLHKHLSDARYSDARRRVRTKLYNKCYRDWDEDDKAAASHVCASYDQAGILITSRVISRWAARKFLGSSWGVSICDQYEALSPFLDDRQTPRQSGREFFWHFGDLYHMACAYHRKRGTTRQEK